MIKIAIVGCGFMGITHANAYREITAAELIAVCDKNKALSDKMAQEYGCRAFYEMNEMLENIDSDVIDICLPTFLHEQAVLQVAKHKKHVFCEKPVTLGLESCRRMVEAVEGTGKLFMIGQVVRFWPEYTEAMKLYKKGRFGKIKSVFAGRISAHPNWSEWYAKAENSGGGLFDLHLHDIDFLCYMFGRPRQVFAVGAKNEIGCWNHVTSTLRFQNGICATAQGIMEMQEGYPFTMELRIAGEDESMEFRMRAGVNLENVASAQRESWLYRNGRAPEKMNISEEDAYKIELEYFIECIEKGLYPDRITTMSVQDTLETILAIRTSLEKGLEVQL